MAFKTASTPAKNTLYWHDYETFGIDPKRDRPVQFAGIRTDEELNIIGEPLVIYCRPADDFLPNPQACMVTGISPQLALKEGLSEAEFIARIHAEIAQPGTCTVGYNNLRFDDEFTRYTLYRNFYDPYAREWKNGNSRWDIIDLLRLTNALRPQGINWPKRDDGQTSFRLEELSKANNIIHESAHDALSDVLATIEVARLVKTHQPRLYQYIYEHRSKHKVQDLFNLQKQTPLVHISGMFPAERGHSGIVVPIAVDAKNKNALIVYELHSDPSDLLTMSVEQIQHLTFTKTEELTEGEQRLPLKTIHLNKCPVLVPLKTLTQDNIKRWSINLEQCAQHLVTLKTDQTLSERVQQAFKQSYAAPSNDPDQNLYSGGFFSPADKDKMNLIRKTAISELGDLDLNFEDERLEEMLFRYRCRNYPETLFMHEIEQWNNYRIKRMTTSDGDASIKLDEYQSELNILRDNASSEELKHLINQLEVYPALIGLTNNR
ncbi:MAG: exodeoxyribonuclease I [gamma proteobacterium symbiont of Bathyaustriella thionipta]|nr:exodeoxyribonuclease I [gamma proteobacterium symbiont of Bathyaustriella thionipta]MCU7949884.1 exodeoxyribonuclease I [gamma proteobacterium symbiont of Bathyaustriella thionipta]MCU7953913.1 exodeoxyribonuclease I [gamma proteobacterium symbiont of Bathyaustriella thionipta]MCU7956481.1 exodeoxyribonuclease I [gamma proteobacterium symbiont of Bathyaustriella thionipta]MCU7965703.1 exodeoxyribonuclease I [gamma proteobacterium symbiont of Bathyaustriella thionipta]